LSSEPEWLPEWRWSRIHPAWVRWLPCAIANLRVVPADTDAFPRSWWDQPELKTPWDDPVWCDPGSRDEYLAETDDIQQRHEEQRHFDRVIEIRHRRIATFTELCQRAEVPIPLTLRELLDCMIRLGLMEEFTEDGQVWIASNLDLNPLDLLALTPAEAAAEATIQQQERAVLAGIGLRRAAELAGPHSSPGLVRVSLRELAAHADLPPLTIRQALIQLIQRELWITADPGVDLATIGLTTPLTIHADHAGLTRTFDMEELQPPEHLA
jgi:hypothetical protein